MKKVKLILAVCCLLTVIFAFSACGSSPKKDIVGDWVFAGTDEVAFSFNKDGSFRSSEGSGSYAIGNKSITFRVESEKEVYEWNEEYLNNYDGWYVDGDFLFIWNRYYIRAGKDRDRVLKKYIGKNLEELSREDRL